ncbi:MAG TPA: hypothetical protein DD471_01510 [Planctomycetes bacterium]|jgi:hypothetical protein|nr:hypothetical protein [Planctomycetota bacterium]
MAKNSEEIIERKEGSPVATSCLIIACVAILGAVSLQIAEITQVRAEWDLEEKNLNRVTHVQDDLDAITSKIDGILDKSKLGDLEKAKEVIKEGDKKVEKAKAIANGEDPVEEDSDSKDEEAPEKGGAEDAPDKEGDASEDSEPEDL